MKRIILCCIFLSLLLSCSNDNPEVNLQKQIQTDTSGNASAVLFSDPLVIDSSRVVIYPLILEKTSYGGSFSSSGGGDRTSFWNLLFFNTDNNSQHLLTNNKKIIIYSINLDGGSSYSSHKDLPSGTNIYKTNIFYNVISNDFNQNEYLDNDDPTYLFVSDKQGNNFRQISPDNFNIISWEIVTGTSKIILQAQKDNNGDKKFDQKDQVIPFIVDVSSGNLAAETFKQTYLDSLKIVLSTNWKSVKK